MAPETLNENDAGKSNRLEFIKTVLKGEVGLVVRKR
jgi:hypothetical protein